MTWIAPAGRAAAATSLARRAIDPGADAVTRTAPNPDTPGQSPADEVRIPLSAAVEPPDPAFLSCFP